MRKQFLCLCFLMLLTFFSCQKEERCFSCDSKVDKFVKENAETLKKSNVANLIKYNRETQRSAYRSFSNEKKTNLWREKFSIILKNPEQVYSTEELFELKKLSMFISNKTIGDSEAIRKFVDAWIERTSKKFFWDISRYHFLLFSLEYNENSFRSKFQPSAVSVTCNCNLTNSGVLIDDCPTVAPECRTSPECNTSSSGCGYFWANACNGDCYPEGTAERAAQR